MDNNNDMILTPIGGQIVSTISFWESNAQSWVSTKKAMIGS